MLGFIIPIILVVLINSKKDHNYKAIMIIASILLVWNVLSILTGVWLMASGKDSIMPFMSFTSVGITMVFNIIKIIFYIYITASCKQRLMLDDKKRELIEQGDEDADIYSIF